MPPDRLGSVGRRVVHVFPGFAIGGAQMRFAEIANHWGRRFRHVVVSLDGNLACRERLAPGLEVSFADPGLASFSLFDKLRRIRAWLAETGPDTLVTSNWGAIEWALARLLPGSGRFPRHIHTEDGFGPEERNRQLPRRVWTRRLALQRATVVLPSRNLLRIATDIWRLDSSLLRYVPNGVDLARFAGPKPPSPWQATPGPVIGTVATLRPEKNLGRLLLAFRQVATQSAASPCLVVVGEGPERPALQAQAAALGLTGQVVFTGHLAQPQAAIRHFDLFALASDTEQMPLSILEAMAAGLPIASTDVGDIRAMLSTENQPFVTPLDPAPLANALLALLALPGTGAAIGAANRRKAERDYGQQAMFDTYASLWDGAG